VPKGGGRIFAAHVRPSAIAYRDCSALLAGQEALTAIILPLLEM
jgi:hypothetical protein